MKNIFEHAFFGKTYKTRDGKQAIFQRIQEHNAEIWYHLFTDSKHLICEANGLHIGDHSEIGWEEWDDDIISEWEEPQITEDELREIAFNHYCKECRYCKEANAKTLEEKYEACQNSICYRKSYVWKLMNGFVAGYLKAIKGD